MKTKLTKKEIHKITHCPKCGGCLEDYELLLKSIYTYCPKCNLTKLRLMSMPFFCEECDCENYIEDENKQAHCFLCNGMMRGMTTDTFYKYKKEGKLKRGYYISNTRLPKKLLIRKHQKNHEINPIMIRVAKDVFKIICNTRRNLEYISATMEAERNECATRRYN